VVFDLFGCPGEPRCGLGNTDTSTGRLMLAVLGGYADYPSMQTEEFQDALEALIHMSRQKRVAIMCAEAVPWRCHRSLVADALSVRGVPVIEILSESSYRMHKLTPFAQVEGVRITYPPKQATLL
jgi:hypothetical protein